MVMLPMTLGLLRRVAAVVLKNSLLLACFCSRDFVVCSLCIFCSGTLINLTLIVRVRQRTDPNLYILHRLSYRCMGEYKRPQIWCIG